jgi:hypothetical protein
VNSADSFSPTYREARLKFCDTAKAAGGRLDRMVNPNLGPEGEELSTDLAWFGPADAERVLVMISGTHGVEGFCGSGAQVDWMRRGEHARLPGNVAALLIHAINPYGFAWLRRVTEENVDLNRNWVPFNAGPLPVNAPYAELREALCPLEWTEASRSATAKVLSAFAEAHGFGALVAAASGGQYIDDQGIFYGGREPTWARKTQTAIFAEYLAQAGKVGIIDYHTGLGPWGYGEQIVSDDRSEPGFQRASAWYGAAVASTAAGDSASARLTGDGLDAAPGLLPHAEVTGVALEYGTLSGDRVLYALRADNWLHTRGDPRGPEAAAVKAQIRDAFYGDADDWRGMVAGQSLIATRQAVAGLGR